MPRRSYRAQVIRPIAWAVAIGCLGCASGPGCREAAGRIPVVILHGADGQTHCVRVEVTDRDADRIQGLMYRKHLDPDAGMLFVYPVEDDHSFWMKNTVIPLDMIFISANRRVVGLIQDTVPFSLDHLSVGVPSQFILEVNAGFVRQHQIRAASPVSFEDIAAVE